MAFLKKFIFLFTCCYSLLCFSKDSLKTIIYWHVNNYPPLLVPSSSSDTEEDVLTEIYDAIQKQFPQYEHKKITVSIQHALKVAESSGNICSLLLYSTPYRKKIFYYSRILGYLLPPLMLVESSQLQKIKKYIKNNILDIQYLLQDTNIRFFYEDTRFYGKELNTFLKNYPEKIYSQQTLTQDFIKGDIDAILEYPIVFLHALNKQESNNKEYTFFYTEYTPDVLPLSVSCSQTKFGKQIIEGINKHSIASLSHIFMKKYLKKLPPSLQIPYQEKIKNYAK